MKRISFDINEGYYEDLQQLQEDLGCDSVADVLNASLTLMMSMNRFVSKGYHVASHKEFSDGPDKIRKLVMSGLTPNDNQPETKG